MRLSQFILANIECILQEWEDFARTMQPAHREMDANELRDHAEEMLRAIAADLDTPQNEAERDLKAKGQAPRAGGDSPAEIHAETRLISGFTLNQLVAEYRALRAGVLRLWMNRDKMTVDFDVEDINRFNEAIDQSLCESIARYSKKLQQAQDIFVGVIGHDLRAPLQSINLGAEFLMRTESDPNLVQLGSRLFNSANRMGAILDNLVDFTKSRTGGMQLHRRQTDLAAVAEQVIDEFRFSNPDRAIRLDLSGKTKGQFDQSRIGQVLQNLISNALQYGAPNSEVIVTISGDANEHAIHVHNQGKPIKKNVQQHIFDPLRRYTDENQPPQGSGKNLGLGLFIVKEIVSAHHGTIGVNSGPDDGTTFTIRLPRTDPKPCKTAAA
jgi:signal transduction histidine kinase